MHHKYTTLGFIVNTRGSKEADMLYSIYTEDFGMVFASATSVRLSKSKLRPHLFVGVLLSLTVLKTKTGWKLVEAKQMGEMISLKNKGYKIFARMLSVLKSLIHGEEKNESLFEVVLNMYKLILEKKDTEIGEGIEMLGMIKILGSLGYGTDIGISKYIDKDFDEATLDAIFLEKAPIVKEINKALKATGF
ncbi:MAG: repair protein RecO, repair protein RecO [Candidatus Taylorbacteria bacterium]|nr:repair protein RecO, repair protein RecO [Candidatus Taylorbacteria bacterium]